MAACSSARAAFDVWQVDSTGTASVVAGSSGANGLLTEYDGRLYLQFNGVLGAYDGTTFSEVPGAPDEPD